MALNNTEGVDLRNVNPNAEYTLQQVSALFPYSVQALRKEIKEGNLKARRKGKYLFVKGAAAISWWKTD